MSMTAHSAALTPTIDMAPMIDILLALVTVWLVILSQTRHSIRLQLPSTTPEGCIRLSNPIVLQLLPDGGFAINQVRVPEGELDTRLHMIYDARLGKLIFVDASPNRSYQEVVDAMDRARGAGVVVIGLSPPH